MTNIAVVNRADRTTDTLVSETGISYVAAVFDNVNEAKSAYKTLNQAQQEGTVHIIDAAYAEKTEGGKLNVHDHGDWAYGKGGPGEGAVVVGGLVGIIAEAILLPASIGALVWGVIMGVYGHEAKLSYKDLEEVANTLPVGTSALVTIVKDEFAKAVELEMQKQGGRSVHSGKIPESTVASLSSP
jgi:uncharacterized membrane protein